MFSDSVCAKIGNYVYRLIDPRTGETFYVGKGKKNRVFSHAKAERDLKFDEQEDQNNAKLDQIRAIHDANLQVLHIIHRHGIPDNAIYEVEAAVIDAYAGLANIQSGHRSATNGIMHSDEIIAMYELPELETHPTHRLVLINVNKSINDTTKDLYDAVRFCWRVSKQKVEQADYIIAVNKGVTRGVFIADKWLLATQENFPDLVRQDTDNGRYGFIGRQAEANIQEYYVGKLGKRIIDPKMKHYQYPVRYWKIK